MKNFIFLIILTTFLPLGALHAITNFEMPPRTEVQYTSPTNRFIEYYGHENVIQALKSNGLSLEHRNFFEHIIPHEELGFFGYHSSTQGFRIFQDIIRIVLEEICEIPIRQDFHFLRIPGKPHLNRRSAKQFLADYPSLNDHLPEQRDQLVSVNYSLFGNFNNFGECTVYWFTTNTSAMTIGFQVQLQYLFELLGIPTHTLAHLFTIGSPLMSLDNAILFQFFDFSHHNAFCKHYSVVDQMCYNSHPMGRFNPSPQHAMSENYLGSHPSQFPAQFRLVINNSVTLNPYSPIHIRRFERNDPLQVMEYETNLRKAIKTLPYDKAKAMQYRETLMNIWGQSNE